MVLARLRQLAAHEVGHTLGLQHNYAASPVRSSVGDGLSGAVRAKLGPMVFQIFPMRMRKESASGTKSRLLMVTRTFQPVQTKQSALDQILSDAFSRGLMYLTDQDARPASASSSVAHLWDNGRNVVDELGNVMKVRACRPATLRREQHSRRRADGDNRRCACTDLHVSPLSG